MPPSVSDWAAEQPSAYVEETACPGRRASERPKPRSDDASDVTSGLPRVTPLLPSPATSRDAWPFFVTVAGPIFTNLHSDEAVLRSFAGS
jgi:hypothetical protein